MSQPVEIDPRGHRFNAVLTSVVIAAAIVALGVAPALAIALTAFQLAVFAIGGFHRLTASPYALAYARAVRPRIGPPPAAIESLANRADHAVHHARRRHDVGAAIAHDLGGLHQAHHTRLGQAVLQGIGGELGVDLEQPHRGVIQDGHAGAHHVEVVDGHGHAQLPHARRDRLDGEILHPEPPFDFLPGDGRRRGQGAGQSPQSDD